jgi:molybdopterin molybdotransferase
MSAPPTDCCSDPKQKLLSVKQGLDFVLDNVEPLTGSERVPLRSALNRILAEEVVSSINVPPFPNSAMDGYALRSGDCSPQAETALTVIGSSFAGDPFQGEVGEGQCVRIMTGAVMPEGADAVLMQEQVERDGERIVFAERVVKAGANVRYAGEDIHLGNTVLETGKKLGAAEIGLLASIGVGEVRVSTKLRVAFFSTGDELSSIGTPLTRGKIYDSNRYILSGMLTQLGLEIIDLGVVPDRAEAVRAALREAAVSADLVLTSGGVSVGEADYVTDALAELGEISFIFRSARQPGIGDGDLLPVRIARDPQDERRKRPRTAIVPGPLPDGPEKIAGAYGISTGSSAPGCRRKLGCFQHRHAGLSRADLHEQRQLLYPPAR